MLPHQVCAAFWSFELVQCVWRVKSVFSKADCLFSSVLVFLHSHLLLCLPVLDSRQVSGSLSWLTPRFSCIPATLRAHAHIRAPSPASLLALPSLFVPLSVSGMWIICTASLPSCAWDWILLPSVQMGFFYTHCSRLCACVLLVWLPKCHSAPKLA